MILTQYVLICDFFVALASAIASISSFPAVCFHALRPRNSKRPSVASMAYWRRPCPWMSSGSFVVASVAVARWDVRSGPSYV